MKLLTSNWLVMQDVHDSAERLGIFADQCDLTAAGPQLSEWEPIDRLEHLQVLFSDRPYWGRALRYFNAAPWWYRNEFTLDAPAKGSRTVLRFSNVDYFCRIWLNGRLLGEHEGYSAPFEFDVTDVLRPGEANRLMVKVWSPWDEEVRGDAYGLRTFQVVRDLVKGTYEHDDTLIARDVNPVGIYGTVALVTSDGPRFEGRPRVLTTLSDDLTAAMIAVEGRLADAAGAVRLRLRLVDLQSRAELAVHDVSLDPGSAEGHFKAALDVSGFELWNLWDQGSQPLYDLEISLDDALVETRRVAFRSVTLDRDAEQTVFVVNGQRIFVRGTSYFPDVYVSTLTRERYVRDLRAIRAAGFNMVRVHVHVEKDEFYDLCDELGLGLMQDSEYNWTHPVTESWADRLTSIFKETILMLEDHPSLLCWICLNEPGLFDPAGRTQGHAMQISPGPRLYAAVTQLDPSRPAIKGSFCFDDLTSGDTHNYAGSLEGAAGHYTDIDGTTEKLNTEFGFDAPGNVSNVRQFPEIFKRLGTRPDIVAEAQEYQYRLVKYYIEHYRAQRFRPCSGYVQFMFIDLSPQSFYGVYDWWGLPKRSLDALFESNQPVIALIEQTRREATAIWLINDSSSDLGQVTVTWRVSNDKGVELAAGETSVACGANAGLRLSSLDLRAAEGVVVNASITVRDQSGRTLAANVYRDMFNHPPHVAGHPTRMSHELGMRLYSA